MLKDYFDKTEFTDFFIKFYTEQNPSDKDADIVVFAESFYDTCFCAGNEKSTSEIFTGLLTEFSLSHDKVAAPLFHTLAAAVSQICMKMKESPAGGLEFLFSILDLLKIAPEKEDSADYSEISGIFRFLRTNDASIKLLNSFKGVRVLHSVEILKIEDSGRIIVRVHPEQMKALEYEGYTCITHKYLPQQITAKVGSVDHVSSTAELTEFAILKKPFERRKIHRLQPEKPIEAFVFEGGSKTAVQIADISLRGVSLVFEENIAASDSELRLSFTLPVNGGKDMVLRGKIKYIFCEKVYKLGLETFPDIEQEALIKKYLQERMQGIEKELA